VPVFNAGMRGAKVTLWEGGHRVPCFVRWPGGALGPARDIPGLTQAQDVLPTLIDLCALRAPAHPRFDGISLAPALRSGAPVPEDRMLVINYSRMPFGVTPPDRMILRVLEAVVELRRDDLLVPLQIGSVCGSAEESVALVLVVDPVRAELRPRCELAREGVIQRGRGLVGRAL